MAIIPVDSTNDVLVREILGCGCWLMMYCGAVERSMPRFRADGWTRKRATCLVADTWQELARQRCVQRPLPPLAEAGYLNDGSGLHVRWGADGLLGWFDEAGMSTAGGADVWGEIEGIKGNVRLPKA